MHYISWFEIRLIREYRGVTRSFCNFFTSSEKKYVRNPEWLPYIASGSRNQRNEVLHFAAFERLLQLRFDVTSSVLSVQTPR
jgi:hypothetical protein